MTLILLILLLIMAIDAIGDGFRTRGYQILHHISEAIVYGFWGFSIWLIIMKDPISSFEFRWFVVYIISMRITLFNFIYNLTAGNAWYYLGRSNIWDRFVNKAGIGFITFMGLVIFLSSIVRLMYG